jgi:hypothetical protein
MKNKILIISLFGLTLFANKSFCTEKETTENKFFVGVTSGLSQNNSLSGDLYGGINIPLKKMKLDVNFGYSVFKNKTSYSGVNNLQFISHGLFIEGNYYLIEGLYTGLRIAVNYNWINDNSQKLFDNYPDIESPKGFSGTASFLNIGYNQPIGNNVCLKLQAQIGIHNHRVAEGWYWSLSDNSSNDFRAAQFGVERHYEFLYNISIGLVFKL